MRLIDADALKEALNSHWFIDAKWANDCIDNAPTVEVEFELKTENGITYPKALEHMTFTHTLSVEERQNIIEAYMLGANSNIRPQGEWIPVSERLPDISGHKIVCFAKPQRIDNIYIGLAYFDNGRWVGYLKEDIVAWQPLPEPYQKGGAK